MSPTVTVGLDGSAESVAAADWAAREALRREATLSLVHVQQVNAYPYSPVIDDQAVREWAGQITDDALADLTRRYPDLQISAEQFTGRPAQVLTEVAADSAALVLGSRGLGSVLGFIVGSIALPAVSHAKCPVVLVRPVGEPEGDSATAPSDAGDVVLGLKLNQPGDELLSFAFDAAARRSAVLRVVHGWELPPAYGIRPLAVPPGMATELAEEKSEVLNGLLRPWREKFPGVEVEYESAIGQAGHRLLDAAADASLVVVGRRVRRSPIGTHIGSVAHAVMHHSDVPVAVVPHD